MIKRKSFLGISLLAMWFLVTAISVNAADWNPSGFYGLFQIAVNPKTQAVTGYYVSQTGLGPDGVSPRFSCIFYVTGKKEGEKVSIQTYYPEDKKEIILGEIKFFPENNSLRLKLKEQPNGSMACPMVASEEGDQMIRDSAAEWIEIRVIKAKRSHFFESPEAIAPRKTYVVQGDGVQVYESRPGWVLATFEGKNKGWLKEKDLYPK
jgi:hypothetical protein